jgi:hypothetical protein
MDSGMPAFAALAVMLSGLKSDAALKSYRFANFLGEKMMVQEKVGYYFYDTFKNKYTKLLS